MESRRSANVRILTYNVHRCLGSDGRFDPGRIAQVIATVEPDIVALQELDVRRARSGHVHQAEQIAAALSMEMHFHPAFRIQDEEYGDAILTRAASELMKAGELPTWVGRKQLEPRGALWVKVQTDDGPLHVLNTHLGLRRRERLAQVEALLGPEWLGAVPASEPAVLLGDLNAIPFSRVYRSIAVRLRDAQVAAGRRPGRTFPSVFPVLALDHVFVSRDLDVSHAQVLRTPLARIASDHLPLLVELRIASAGAGIGHE